MKKVIGYKGFGKGLMCRDFKYEEGKEYEHKGNISPCSSGFHFCENPLDVLNYYPLRDGNEYATVEAIGDIKKENDKSVTDRIKINTKIELPALIKASVEFIWNKASKKKIFKKGKATSGNDAHSATSGEYAHSATSGYGAHSATSTDDSIACAIGRKSKAKAALGSWIVIAEWKEGISYTDAKPLCVLTAKVDGKEVKANQWYKVVNSKFVETDDSNE